MAKKKKKRRSQAPIALVYFSTMVVFIVVFGFIALGMMNKLSPNTEKVSFSSSSVENADPTDENNQTFLYMVKNDKSSLDSVMVARFMPADGKIKLIPLSPYTTTSDDSNGQTLDQVFQTNGASGIVDAVSGIFGIGIDKYMCMGEQCFKNICNNLGNITYEIPENMYYNDKNSDDNEDIIDYEKGATTLEGFQIRQLMIYPKYKKGYSQNVTVAGELMQNLINSGFKLQTTRDNLGSIYSNLLQESAEKNFTENDFKETEEFYYYIMENFDNPAETLIPTGTWSNNGYKFMIDGTFKAQIKSMFKVEG